MKTKDGDWKWIFGRGKAVYRNLSGNALRMVGTHQDITERKRIETALRESEFRYRTLFEAISDAVYVHDVNGKLIDVNTEAYKRLGYTRDEAIKLFASDIDINHPTVDEVKKRIEPIITSGPLKIESRHRANQQKWAFLMKNGKRFL